VAHVYCEHRPDASFMPIEPTLDDVYFRAIKDHNDILDSQAVAS
jgi:hypothetical protein